MFNTPPIRTLIIACSLSIALFVSSASGCPSCYGDARSSRFDGMNAAILTMIGVTGSVFAGFGRFFFVMRKRMDEIGEENLDLTKNAGNAAGTEE